MLIAAAACEMHPAAVLKGAELASVSAQLNASTAAAAQAGVTDVPAVRIGARVFFGERSLGEAACLREALPKATSLREGRQAAWREDISATSARAR